MQIPEERIQSAKISQMAEPRTKNTEVQTVFRESEAQTDPYSPDYQVDPQNIPEVLSINHYKYRSKLPATMIEMDLIKKMRACGTIVKTRSSECRTRDSTFSSLPLSSESVTSRSNTQSAQKKSG